MTRIPVTCGPEYTLDQCLELMQENQIRRILVVNNRGRCIGIVAQADIALHGPAAQAARTIQDISKPAKPRLEMHFESCFYCGQPHEQDQILLLNRRRELTHGHEVLI
jgi:CBS-domain-containing membrane protein